MSEFNKLERWLSEQKIDHSIEKTTTIHYDCGEAMVIEKNQIIVYDEHGKRSWDAICHEGSYGYKQGLLEIMGSIVKKSDGDDVVGFLTAEDVINRLIG